MKRAADPGRKKPGAVVNAGCLWRKKMSTEIAKLEQAWLQAEAVADQAKQQARAAKAAAEGKRKVANGSGGTMTLLLDTQVELDARHAAAERKASELFDRLWKAKEQGQVHA